MAFHSRQKISSIIILIPILLLPSSNVPIEKYHKFTTKMPWNSICHGSNALCFLSDSS